MNKDLEQQVANILLDKPNIEFFDLLDRLELPGDDLTEKEINSIRDTVDEIKDSYRIMELGFSEDDMDAWTYLDPGEGVE